MPAASSVDSLNRDRDLGHLASLFFYTERLMENVADRGIL